MGRDRRRTREEVNSTSLNDSFRSLDNPDHFNLLSLDPSFRKWVPATDPAGFHGFAILGSASIGNRQTRDELITALRSGVRACTGEEMACFNPRHGIRVTKGSVETDFVICFECRQIEIWRDGKRIAHISTTDVPQSAFDRVLQNAGVPLAPKPH